MKSIVTHFLVFASVFCFAQKEKNNWYFGKAAAINFRSGIPIVKTDNPITTYGHCSASISDPKNGNLLFYTNGKEVRNGDHTSAINGIKIGGEFIKDVLILDNPFESNEYYLMVLSSGLNAPDEPDLSYYKVAVGTNGKCSVSTENSSISKGNFSKITAVKNCRTGGYWLITYNQTTQTFHSYNLNKTGIDSDAILSVNQSGLSILAAGDLVSNHNGRQMAICNLAATNPITIIFDIDKNCGRLTYKQSFVAPNEEYAFGLAFSPDNKHLFVSYSVAESSIWQFELATGKQIKIASSDNNFNELQVGPDGKIYVATHTNHVPGSRIDRINKPNNWGSACQFQIGALNLGSGRSSNFHFPNFIQDYSKNTCENEVPDFKIPNICFGDTLKIILFNSFTPLDQYWWQKQSEQFWEIEPKITFENSGRNQLVFYWEVCNELDSIVEIVNVNLLPEITLPKDTMACWDTKLTLTTKFLKDAKYHWTPDKSDSNSIGISDAGNYQLVVDNGCLDSANTQVGFYDPIWIDLGHEHFICEDFDELLRLDAGKGFEKYRWFPNNDSSQWIDVSKSDSYFVITQDYRGCRGEAGTQVKRRCPYYIYFPNAFSPNADKINDIYRPVGQDIIEFGMEIYNRWGECIYFSTDFNAGWDGTFNGAKSPPGQYLYKCYFSGIDVKKRLRKQYTSGKIMLLK